ncbi:hypothetical protein [Micromonospora sp. WMMD987]|jgi:hypothetical protein|uniref:hypothetical protein n=1 Tax=Micromonospora TaxID=1873 RepID=UPI00249ACA30|nr:hypothetical protein [Micromonospora sp. WMMD987]WFE97838.1 hypothetical protein O7612_13540 [Micromonospora sp. WMMD987]
MGDATTDSPDGTPPSAPRRPGGSRPAETVRSPSALDAWGRANRRGQCDWSDPDAEPHLIRGLD